MSDFAKAKDSREVCAFLDEIEAVCRKHGMSIGHEDGHGAFVIRDLDQWHLDWLREAFDERGKPL